jgi:glutamyl-tRNA synthetase/nondiscriminating glutamyl-tRNA synthetase
LSKRHGATSVAEFRERGVLPEALVNYLALLGWSPGGNEELVGAAEMAERFDLAAVSHSAAVFDTAKLAWINRHYLKGAAPARIAREAVKYFVRAGYVTDVTATAVGYLESLLPMGVGSVDQLDELPSRVAFVFEWDAGRAAELTRAEPEGAPAVAGFAAEIAGRGALDRDGFRAAVGRVRAATGLKGRALLHPIRVALTAAESGPELDLAVPAIDSGAALDATAGVARIASCAERAAAVARLTASL